MDRIVVRGRGMLRGEVSASGSKNSTLALMAGALLARGETHLSNVPRLRDVTAMLEILRALGARAEWDVDDEHTVRIDASTIRNPEAPYDLVRKMRASFLVLGPLLARYGTARVSEPGGCAIGVRPIDQHLKGLRALGAKLTLDHGYVEATAARLVGGRVTYADLSLAQVVAGIQYAFPTASKKALRKHPRLAKLHDAVFERPRIKRYAESGRRLAFNDDDLFRNYPELDG